MRPRLRLLRRGIWKRNDKYLVTLKLLMWYGHVSALRSPKYKYNTLNVERRVTLSNLKKVDTTSAIGQQNRS